MYAFDIYYSRKRLRGFFAKSWPSLLGLHPSLTFFTFFICLALTRQLFWGGTPQLLMRKRRFFENCLESTCSHILLLTCLS